MKNVAIIGAGASGMAAAVSAASADNKVVLFEKQKKPGRKLLATGNGRCNITNTSVEITNYHGRNTEFLHNVFFRCGKDDVLHFFRELGMPIVEERDGRMFPASFQASTVVDIFMYEMKKRSVEIELHRRIDSIQREKNGFKLLTAGKEEHLFDSVIIAAGSCAWPSLGASKNVYDTVKKLGHTVYDVFPSIVPLNIPAADIHRLQGIKWDCRLTVMSGGKTVDESEGEVLFTGYGISGPAALDVSRSVNQYVINGKEVSIYVDFFPGLSGQEIGELMDIVWNDPGKKISFSLLSVLKQRIPELLLSRAKISPDKRVGNLTGREREELINTMKSLELKAGNPRGFQDAVVASGGVSVDEIYPETMESRIIPNLFITGELLDIDGDSGGYNLQFAWSSGILAGRAQAEG